MENVEEVTSSRIQVSEQEYCKPEVTYHAEPSKVLEVRDQVLSEVAEEASKIQISGYRKGKAPISVLKLKYKKLIEERTKRQLVDAAYDEIIFETKMKTIFSPQITHVSLTESSFECAMTLLRKPTFELKQYTGFEIPKPHQTETQGDRTEKRLQELRVKHGEVSPYQAGDFVEDGDKITMDVTTTVNGVPIPQFSRVGEMYTVGYKFIPEFDDNILGMVPDEERTFDVPWDSSTKERAMVTVKVHMGTKRIPAALDDEFAKLFGKENLADLRAEISSTEGRALEREAKEEIHQQILNRLIEQHEFEVPSWLILMDAQQIAEQYRLAWKDVPEEAKIQLLDQAKKRLRTTLILEAIRDEQKDLEFSYQEILGVLREKVRLQGEDPESFLVEAQKSGRLYGIVAGLQQEATMDWLVKQSKIIN